MIDNCRIVVVAKTIEESHIERLDRLYGIGSYDICIPNLVEGLSVKRGRIYTDDEFLDKEVFNRIFQYSDRKAWYYQQFLKYAIVLGVGYDRVAILDGDTVVRADVLGNASFGVTGNKTHQPYRRMNQKLLNFDGINKYSCVVNYLLFDKKILLNAFNYCGATDLHGFIRKVSETLQSDGGKFSEYQFYADYALLVDGERYSTHKVNVFRRFDLISTSYINGLKKYDVVSWEYGHRRDLVRLIAANVFFFFSLNLS